jgi:predicted metalloprotease with PDZ domain
MSAAWKKRGAVVGAATGIGLVLAMMAVAATSESRVEIRSTPGADGQPEVHVWVNGKEVPPEQFIDPATGAVRIEARAGDAARPAAGGEAYLGVMVSPYEGSKIEGGKAAQGVVVTGMMPESPAAKAGIQMGDVITDVGGTAIESPQQLVTKVREYKPGQDLKVVLFRDGKRMEKSVALAARPATAPESVPPPAPEAPRGEAMMGVVVVPLMDEMKEIAGIDHGALVNTLTDDSPAAKAGLLPGDVIVSIDGKDITSAAELAAMVRQHKPGDTIKVVAYRSGKKRNFEVKLVAKPADRMPEALPGVPEELFQDMPELRQFMEELRKNLEEGMRIPGQMPPEIAPRLPRVEPAVPGAAAARILERLDKIDARLGQIEKRLEAIEKKK